MSTQKVRKLTNNNGPRNVSLIVVWKQNQFGNKKGVVEPDPKYHTDAQPAHRVHHEVQSKLHGCWEFWETYSVPNAKTHTNLRH